MIFTQGQILDMLAILKRYELVFIAGQLGLDFLSQTDKDILIAAGVDLDKFKNKKGIVEHAFLFGILAEAVGDKRAQKMKYSQFKKFLESGKFIPLTEEEEFALQTVKNRAYTDITSLGNRMRTAVSNNILKNNQEQAVMVRRMIRQKTIKAQELRYGARNLAAEFAETSKDWEVDWLRIAYYLTHEAFNSGRAQSILKNYGEDAEVYFDVYPGACIHCKELLLTNPEDVNSEPIVFKLKDIIANGNNIYRKVADWKATISPIHPYCRCTINRKKPGFGWNPELRAFTTPLKKKSEKLKGVKLDIKISKSEDDDLEKAHEVGDLHPNGKWVWTEYRPGKFDWRGIPKKKTDALSKNLEDIEKELGVKVGKPMSFKEANEGRVNPYFKLGKEWQINCQTCVVTYELRRRGFDVMSLPLMNEFQDKLAFDPKLSYDTNPDTGDKPEELYFPDIKNKNKLKTIFLNYFKRAADVGRYQLAYRWESGSDRGSHIITMEKLPSGKLRFYDPQSGLEKDFSTDIVSVLRMSAKVPLEFMRVDNLPIKVDIVKELVKEVKL